MLHECLVTGPIRAHSKDTPGRVWSIRWAVEKDRMCTVWEEEEEEGPGRRKRKRRRGSRGRHRRDRLTDLVPLLGFKAQNYTANKGQVTQGCSVRASGQGLWHILELVGLEGVWWMKDAALKDLSAEEQRGKQLDREDASGTEGPAPRDGVQLQEACREDGEKDLEPEQLGRKIAGATWDVQSRGRAPESGPFSTAVLTGASASSFWPLSLGQIGEWGSTSLFRDVITPLPFPPSEPTHDSVCRSEQLLLLP